MAAALAFDSRRGGHVTAGEAPWRSSLTAQPRCDRRGLRGRLGVCFRFQGSSSSIRLTGSILSWCQDIGRRPAGRCRWLCGLCRSPHYAERLWKQPSRPRICEPSTCSRPGPFGIVWPSTAHPGRPEPVVRSKAGGLPHPRNPDNVAHRSASIPTHAAYGPSLQMWQRYYRRWKAATREQLDPGMLELLPPLAKLCPPAQIIDKTRYSAFAEPALLQHLQAREAEGLIVTWSETDVCVLATVSWRGRSRIPSDCGAGRRLQLLKRRT